MNRHMPQDADLIAVLNAGSSSLKFSLFRADVALCQGTIDRLNAAQTGEPRAAIRGEKQAMLFDGAIPARSHEQALEWLFAWLEETKPEGVPLLYVGRPWRASPSEGYPTAHLREQDRIVRTAMSL